MAMGLEEQKAFQKSKDALNSADYVLVHFDSEKDIILACDTSPYGIGAVLSHRLEDGREKPIAFASRTLTPAEKKYSQLEKEGLAIIFGVISISTSISLEGISQLSQITSTYSSCSVSHMLLHHWLQL